MSAAIQAINLRKNFGTFQAVKDVSFTIPRGQCIGLLGPNGAGKTTTMRMMMGLTDLSSGKLTVLGRSPDNLSRFDKAKIGLVPQEDNLDPDLGVAENLYVYGGYFGLSRAYLKQRVPELLAFMGLESKADNEVRALSGGMKRRLVIARALLADPELVILDEPTTGLDPQARQMIWGRLIELKKQGKTLLLTTHYMDEAQRLCDHIVMLDDGKVLTEGTPRKLVDSCVPPHVYEIIQPVPTNLFALAEHTVELPESCLLYVQDSVAFEKSLAKGQRFFHRRANLEDVFLNLTGRQLRD